ncbi:nitroreductase family protein [Enterocloster citroniae]|uniref:nitroreductase family protein n=1 Tax=Enterocloster citroniae TaxID=358743 RepID=UPI0032BFE9C9
MEFQKVMKERYACKKFDGRPVETSQLHAILEAGRLAPTAKNLQEQRIYVVQSEEALAKLDNVTPCRYGAATVAVVAFDKNNRGHLHQTNPFLPPSFTSRQTGQRNLQSGPHLHGS